MIATKILCFLFKKPHHNIPLPPNPKNKQTNKTYKKHNPKVSSPGKHFFKN